LSIDYDILGHILGKEFEVSHMRIIIVNTEITWSKRIFRAEFQIMNFGKINDKCYYNISFDDYEFYKLKIERKLKVEKLLWVS
jgi:hypothetical protein